MKNLFIKLFDKKHKKMTIAYLLVVFLYLFVEVLINTNNISYLLTTLLVPTCCYVVVALGLNLVVGFSGDLSLGQAGFMCIGAFAGVCAGNYIQFLTDSVVLRIVVAIIVGALIAGIFGYIISIPVFKLTGDYLAIVTLAFCQIIKSFINNVYFGYDSKGLHFSFIENTVEIEKGGHLLINGPVGITGNTKFSSFTICVVLILVSLFVVFNLINSKYGRAIMATRENRVAANSVGIDVTKAKTLAFVISACLAGAGGALYALNYTTIAPSKFDFNLSILILVYVVLGGLGNVSGTIIATICLVLLPELLRFLSDYRMIIYALVLILIMLISNNEKLKIWFAKAKERLLSSFSKKAKGKETK